METPFHEFAAGDVIFREGDPGQEMYIIESGQIAIVREAVGPDPLAVLDAGDFFGEMSVLEDLPRFASAIARTPVRLLRIDRSSFVPIIRENAEIAVRIMRKLSGRLRGTELRVEQGRQPSGTPAAATTTESGALQLFQADTNQTIELPERFEDLLIGRPDPVTGTLPDLNLAQHDPKRTLSRRHARLMKRADGLYLCEELGCANGTYLNGEPLRTGEPVRVETGDMLRFGLVEFELRRAG